MTFPPLNYLPFKMKDGLLSRSINKPSNNNLTDISYYFFFIIL